MKRRVFLASSVVGVASLSGCMGLFSNDSDDNNEQPEEPDPNEEITPPHNGLSPDGISNSFMENHFQALDSSQGYTTVYTETTNQGSTKETTWKREGNKGYVTKEVASDLVQEQYYSGEYLGITSPTSSPNILDRTTPPVTEWANARFLRAILTDGTFSIDSENDSTVIYAGVIDWDGSNKGVQVHISKERPIVTQINISDLNRKYEITDVGSTSVEPPEWFTEARNSNVIANGGVYEDAEALIIQPSEGGQPIPKGSLVSVIPPKGDSVSIELEEEVPTGKNIYIVFRNGEPYYSVGQLPSISGRDNLEDGIYIVRGISPEGDKQYELQLMSDSSESN